MSWYQFRGPCGAHQGRWMSHLGGEKTLLYSGLMLAHHRFGDCRHEGHPCPLHMPSDHHMVGWPLSWRDDISIMERVCEHGVGHPDPDDREVFYHPELSVHGCDGCCRRDHA